MVRVLDLESALAALAAGRVIAVPTDTVYGVAASIESPSAVAALFELKHRPRSLALPVLVDSVDQIVALGVDWTPPAQRLSSNFWPGALTIVVRTPDELARRVRSDSSSVGFRIPDLALLRELIKLSGPLAVTSANRHAEPPCQSVADVLEVFGESIDLGGVLDGGDCDGTVSTVVDLTNREFRVLRSGAIGEDAIGGALH